MALFRRRRPTDEQIDAHTVSTARRLLAEAGIEATIEHAGTDDATLVAAERRHPLHNLLGWVREADPGERDELIARHLRILIDADGRTDASDLDAGELRRRIRTRLLAPGDDGMPTSYERVVAPGLTLALCLDFPEIVQTLGDSALDGFALELDELYDAGARNVALEPIDEHSEVAPGVWLVSGNSLFIATKAADMPTFISAVAGPAPYGIVFGVPFRHVLVYTVLRDADSMAAVQRVFDLSLRFAAGDFGTVAGGVVGDGIWFWRDGAFQRIGGPAPSGDGYAISADGAFLDALEQIAAI